MAFFQKVRFVFLNLQISKKVYSKFNFKLRIVFWNILFWRFGDLKTHHTFWKKATFSNKDEWYTGFIRFIKGDKLKAPFCKNDLELLNISDHPKTAGFSSITSSIQLSWQKNQIRSFVFWENLWRANLLCVLSDL